MSQQGLHPVDTLGAISESSKTNPNAPTIATDSAGHLGGAGIASESTKRTQRDSCGFLAVGLIATALMILIAVTARMPTYRVSPIFLVPLLWLPYYFRRGLNLTPTLFALLASALLLHDLGAYGYYQTSPWFLPVRPFDNYVHFWFAVVGAIVLRRALAHHFGHVLKPWQLDVTTLLFIMGTGALHEIVEYMSYLILGEGKSMLRPSVMYFFDTQRDLTNNLIGVVVGLVGYSIVRRAVEPPNTRGFEILQRKEASRDAS